MCLDHDMHVRMPLEGDIGVCSVAVLVSFYAVFRRIKSHIAVFSNPVVCDVCVFKPPVYGETKLFAVLRFLVGPLYNNSRPLSSLSKLNLASISLLIRVYLFIESTYLC